MEWRSVCADVYLTFTEGASAVNAQEAEGREKVLRSDTQVENKRCQNLYAAKRM